MISAGFWPGNDAYPHAAFYAYAYPTLAGLAASSLHPATNGGWNADLGEFLLPYAHLTAAADPGAAVQAFLQATFDAGARLLDWPAGLVIGQSPAFGRPPREP